MAKPHIYFCGDKEKCRTIMKSCGNYVRTAFISKRNADRLLVFPSRHPFLICVIFPAGTHADDKLFKKVYAYCKSSRCPLHVIGSRHNLLTVSKYVPESLIQRSESGLMLRSIKDLADYISKNPDAEQAAMKSRFSTVAVISDNAPLISLCENKLAVSSVKPRIIVSSSRCTDKEFSYLRQEKLSGIITDKPLNTNSFSLSEKLAKEQTPVIMLDRKESYGRKLKVVHIDSRSESDSITRIIDDYEKRKSKLLFIRSKNKSHSCKSDSDTEV